MKSELYISGTVATPAGGYIQPRHDPSVLTEGGVLTAQTDPGLIHSWALRNYDANVVFSLGHMSTAPKTMHSAHMHFTGNQQIPYLIASNRDLFLRSLHVAEDGRRGGFIHKVDASGFELTPDRIGQKKWISQQPARVIEEPRFVSLQDVMARHVQVYIVEDRNFVKRLVAGRKQHSVVIQEGLDSGALSCLNESYEAPRHAIPKADSLVVVNTTPRPPEKLEAGSPRTLPTPRVL
jgi:hypothetical protein